MSEPIPRRHRVVASVAIVLGVLGLPQAAWIAWDLFGSGAFEALDSVLGVDGATGWSGWAQTIRAAVVPTVRVVALLLGLVTSAAAIVGGGVALGGRLYVLRWAALASLLHIVLVEILGTGVLFALALSSLAGRPTPVDPTGLALDWMWAYVGPVGLAVLRSAFWAYALSVARAQPVLASDLRPED